MTTQVLTDVGFFIAQYDFTTEMNEVSLSEEIEIPDDTTFRAGTRTVAPGLQGVAGIHHGWYDDAATAFSGGTVPFDNIGTTLAGVHTLLPEGGTTSGERAYFFEATQTKFGVGGSNGELFGFDIEFAPRGDLYGGRLLDDAITLHTASRTGTSYQLGAQVVGTNVIRAVLHVVEFTGTSLDIDIRSDDNSGMATPTTRISFTQAAGVTSEGPLTFTAGTTDDYWDADLTFVGTSFRACIVISLQ